MHKAKLNALISALFVTASIGCALAAPGVEVAANEAPAQPSETRSVIGAGSRTGASAPTPTVVEGKSVAPTPAAKPTSVQATPKLTAQPNAVKPARRVKPSPRRVQPRRAVGVKTTKPKAASPVVRISGANPAPVQSAMPSQSPVIPSKLPAAAPTYAPTVRPQSAPPSARPDKVQLMEAMEAREKSGAKPDGGGFGAALSTILKLGLVAALMYGALLALKAMAGKKPVSHRSAGMMRLMDSVELGPNSSIHLVRVKGKTFLVGSATGQVSLLQEMESSPEDDEVVEETSGRFAEYLTKYSEGPMKGSPAARLAGLVRDCTDQLQKYQNRHQEAAGSKRGGDSGEA